MTELKKRIDEFRSDLGKIEPENIFHKHLLASRSPVLKAEQERDIVFEIAKSFDTPVTSVFLVGSAKLGFRMLGKEEDQRRNIPARDQFSVFDDYSDIDVAIISQSLFQSYWRKVHAYYAGGGFRHFSSWSHDDPAQKFTYYLMHGWIRPDALPATSNYDLRGDWVQKVDRVDNLRIAQAKVKVGLYFDAKFLTNYQVTSINKCKAILETRK